MTTFELEEAQAWLKSKHFLMPTQLTITAKSSWNTNTFLRFPSTFPFLCQ